MVQNATPSGGRHGARSARTQAELLAATERIIRRDGVAALTLERVAEEAGVSKGGLLYHFASKQELINRLLTHTLQAADRRLDQLADGDDPGAFATAYLDYVRSTEHTRSGAAAGIFASAALDEGELGPAKAQFAAWQDRLCHDDGIAPETALLARIVGDGLWLIDLFDLAPPTESERRAVLDMVQNLINTESETSPRNGPATLP